MKLLLAASIFFCMVSFVGATEIKGWEKNIPPLSNGWREYQKKDAPDYIKAYSKDDGKGYQSTRQAIVRVLFKDTQARQYFETYDQSYYVEYGYNINCKRNKFFTVYAIEKDFNGKQVNSNFVITPTSDDWRPVSSNPVVSDMKAIVCK